jgi:hypothetical protein
MDDHTKTAKIEKKVPEKVSRSTPYVELNPRLRPVGSDGQPLKNRTLGEIHDPEWNQGPKGRAAVAKREADQKAETKSLQGTRVVISKKHKAHGGKTGKISGMASSDVHVVSLDAPHRGWAYVHRNHWKKLEEEVMEENKKKGFRLKGNKGPKKGEQVAEEVLAHILEGRGRPRKDGSEADEGDRHIVMQMRKSVALRGANKVSFADGSSANVKPDHAHHFLQTYNRFSKPVEKETYASRASASHKSFLKHVSEDVYSAIVEEFAEKIDETSADFTFHGRSSDPKVKEKIALSKVLAKAHSAFKGEPTQARVRSRLGRNNPDAKHYRGRRSDTEIKRDHGTRHDIYLTKK